MTRLQPIAYLKGIFFRSIWKKDIVMKTRRFGYAEIDSSKSTLLSAAIFDLWVNFCEKCNVLISKTFIALMSLMILNACVSVAGPGGSNKERSASSGINPHYKIGNPYEIVGDGWYYPAVDENYSEIGIASWYGPNFNGKPTANGELFDKNALTAAHRTLPLPSIVEVENLDNGKVILVRVNDRGPFAKNRIIDLSEASAKKLGFINNGTARVRVRFVRKARLELALLKLNDRKGIKALEKELSYRKGDKFAKQNVSQEIINSRDPKILTAGPQAAVRDDAVLNRISSQTHTHSDAGARADDLASLITQSTKPASSSVILPGKAPTSISGVQSGRETTPISPSPERERNSERQAVAIIPQGISAQSATSAVTNGAVIETVYEIQLGAFADSARAEAEAQKAASLGPVFILSVRLDDGRQVHKVMMGPFVSRADAGQKLTAIRRAGYDDAWIVKTSY